MSAGLLEVLFVLVRSFDESFGEKGLAFDGCHLGVG